MVKRVMRRPRAPARKRTTRKMVLRRRPYMGVTGPRISLKRTVYLFNWTFGVASTNDFWRYFEAPISDLPDIAQYQALFDEYKINAVKYTFRPRYDNVQSVNPQVQTTAFAHVIKDPGSTVIPAGAYTAGTVNTFLENGNVKTYKMEKPFSVYYKPRIYNNVASGEQLARPGYIKLTNTGVRHRGFHILLQQQSMSQVPLQLDVFVTLYITLRGQR